MGIGVVVVVADVAPVVSWFDVEVGARSSGPLDDDFGWNDAKVGADVTGVAVVDAAGTPKVKAANGFAGLAGSSVEG